jgi:hypothetical protein
VGNLKGCPSNVGNSEGIIYITSLSTISSFIKNIIILDLILQLLVLETGTENTTFFSHNRPSLAC